MLVPGGFNTQPEPNGDILMYPEGDRSAPPSGRMPKGGLLLRHASSARSRSTTTTLNVEDNLEEFGPISDDDLQYFAGEADRLRRESDRAILANFGGTAFGDIALVPAPWLKHPKGIRDIAEWYMSTVSRFDYVYEVFRRQCDIALENLAKIYDAVGDRVSAVFVTGTDFGTQNGPFISPRRLPQALPAVPPPGERLGPRSTRPGRRSSTSCGSVIALLPDIVEAGFDILNPVQCSAAGMDPQTLKDKFGQRLTFWGGGVDTQKTLPFGTPEEIRRQVRERIEIFGRGGGFVFNTVHNVQAGVPAENLVALYEAVREAR